jgi:hypothetical protein
MSTPLYQLRANLTALKKPPTEMPVVRSIDGPADAVRALAEQAGLLHTLLERTVAEALADRKLVAQVIALSEEARRATTSLLTLLGGGR